LPAHAARSDASTVILDLDVCGDQLPSLVPAVKERLPTVRVIAYCPHVNEALAGSAIEAGCDLVLTRGEFHRRIADLLNVG
jgi:hypothetical protein